MGTTYSPFFSFAFETGPHFPTILPLRYLKMRMKGGRQLDRSVQSVLCVSIEVNYYENGAAHIHNVDEALS